MEANDHAPEDVKRAKPVDQEVAKGGKDDLNTGIPRAEKKKKWRYCEKAVPGTGKVKRKSTPNVECCNKRRKNDGLSTPKYVNVVEWPEVSVERGKTIVIPRHCLTKEEHLKMLSTATSKPPTMYTKVAHLKRLKPVTEHVKRLARPNRRFVLASLQNGALSLPPYFIDNLVKRLEGETCLSPEQAEKIIRKRKRSKTRKSRRQVVSREPKSSPETTKKLGTSDTKCDPLDEESVLCQYLMAERFVHSILEQRESPIPMEYLTDIVKVLTKRLGHVLDYEYVANEDRKSQHMRFLADITASWIAGVILEVAEDHKKALEEFCEKKRKEAEEELEDKDDSGPKPGEEEEEEEDEEEDEGGSGGETSKDVPLEYRMGEEPTDASKADAVETEEVTGKTQGGVEGPETEHESVSVSVPEEQEQELPKTPQQVEEEEEISERQLIQPPPPEIIVTPPLEEGEGETPVLASDVTMAPGPEGTEAPGAPPTEAAAATEPLGPVATEVPAATLEERQLITQPPPEQESPKTFITTMTIQIGQSPQQVEEEEEISEPQLIIQPTPEIVVTPPLEEDEGETPVLASDVTMVLGPEATEAPEAPPIDGTAVAVALGLEATEVTGETPVELVAATVAPERITTEAPGAIPGEAVAVTAAVEPESVPSVSEGFSVGEPQAARQVPAAGEALTVKSTFGITKTKVSEELGQTFTSTLPFLALVNILDTVRKMTAETPSNEGDDLQVNRLHRVIYEKLCAVISSESPEALNEDTRIKLNALCGRIAAWLRTNLGSNELLLLDSYPPEVESMELREWSHWLASLTENANNWNTWLRNVVAQAEEIRDENVTRAKWSEWTSGVDKNALLWRRFYKQMVHQADRNVVMMIGRQPVKTGTRKKVTPGELLGRSSEELIETTDLG